MGSHTVRFVTGLFHCHHFFPQHNVFNKYSAKFSVLCLLSFFRIQNRKASQYAHSDASLTQALLRRSAGVSQAFYECFLGIEMAGNVLSCPLMSPSEQLWAPPEERPAHL